MRIRNGHRAAAALLIAVMGIGAALSAPPPPNSPPAATSPAQGPNPTTQGSSLQLPDLPPMPALPPAPDATSEPQLMPMGSVPANGAPASSDATRAPCGAGQSAPNAATSTPGTSQTDTGTSSAEPSSPEPFAQITAAPPFTQPDQQTADQADAGIGLAPTAGPSGEAPGELGAVNVTAELDEKRDQIAPSLPRHWRSCGLGTCWRSFGSTGWHGRCASF